MNTSHSNPTADRLLFLYEAAAILRIGRSKMYSIRKDPDPVKRLQTMDVAGEPRVFESELNDWLRRNNPPGSSGLAAAPHPATGPTDDGGTQQVAPSTSNVEPSLKPV
jgi:hypothetical protein